MRKRDQRGAAAVELALVLPLLVMLLIGTVTTGLSYSRAIGITNAVREGARFGATGESTSSTWADDVIARTRETQFDDLTTPYETSICVELYKEGTGPVTGKTACSSGAAPTPSSTDYPSVPAGLPTGACIVRVVAARKYQINAVLASWDRVMKRGSVARYERDTC